jgi:CHAT domain-containing protein
VRGVSRGGIADLFGVLPGDVLLTYDGKGLSSPADRPDASRQAAVQRVTITLWREGEIRRLEVPPGPLGVESDPNLSVTQVVVAQRSAVEVLEPTRDEGLILLPGTRREVRAIADLFPEDRVTLLLGKGATESALQRMAREGQLKRYGYIHLATHGRVTPGIALGSTLFLAEEPTSNPSSPDPVMAGDGVTDGRITAEQIVRTWDLDTELVVISACQTGLGRYASGEGYLGFAQAMFIKGARSLVLSLWKVDDEATALLMERFYQNLLGRRAGLKTPLPKAAALDEAKRWLRGLTAAEVGRLGRLKGDRLRGKVEKLPPLHDEAGTTKTVGAEHPFAHPYYWAAFVLIGAPG